MPSPTFNYTSPPTAVTALSTELDALADGANALSGVIDPGGNAGSFVAPNARPAFMWVELSLASFTPGSNPYAVLWVLHSIDGGTNYEGGDASLSPSAGALVVTRAFSNAVSSKRIMFPRLEIPPFHCKLLLGNRAGAAFPGSGSTLKYRIATPQFPSV